MLLVCLIWGVNFSMMKYVLRFMPPMGVTAIRFVTASVVLWLVAKWLEPDARLTGRTLLILLGLGVLGNTLYQMGFINGLVHTTAGNSALLIASTPLMTAVLGTALGLEKMTRPVALAILLGTTGIVLVVLGHGDKIGFSRETMAGDSLTLVAVVSWSVFTHAVHRVGTAATPLQVAAYTTIGGTPGLVLAGWTDLQSQDWSVVTPAAWAAIFYSSLLSIVVCYVIWNRSLSRIGANRTALFGITTPLFALAAAALMLGERPSMGQLIGAVFILASVAVNVLAHWRQEMAVTRQWSMIFSPTRAHRTPPADSSREAGEE
jgi:drug/metabolite transporter (DMT)-like permease